MRYKRVHVYLVRLKFRLRQVRDLLTQISRERSVYLTILSNLIFIILLATIVPITQLRSITTVVMLIGSLLGIIDYVVLNKLGIYPKGLLSNIYGLFIVSLLAIIVCISRFNAIFIAFCAGILVSLTAGIWIDRFIDGHYDNWLRILSPDQVDRLKGWSKARLTTVITFFFLFNLVSCIISFFGLAKTINSSPFSVNMLLLVNKPSQVWLVGLILLFCLIIWLSVNCLVAIRKYTLASPTHKLRAETESLRLIWTQFIKREKTSANQVIKQIQRDQALWIIILSLLITALDVTLYATLLGKGVLFGFMFFMIPFTVVILFGTIGHSTSCELGGAYGVLLSILLIRIISLVVPSYPWTTELIIVSFWSAVAAWLVGIVAGKQIKGTLHMSFLTFVIQVDAHQGLARVPNFVNIIRDSMQSGYKEGITDIFGSTATIPQATIESGVDLTIRTEDDMLLLGDGDLHLSIAYKQRPVLQLLYYSLCPNLLYKPSKLTPLPLPKLPVEYHYPGHMPDTNFLDAVGTSNGTYRTPLKGYSGWEFPCFVTNSNNNQAHGYRKTLSEFFDDMVTKSLDIQTDVFCFTELPPNEKSSKLTVIGFCRGITSTKSYATMEAEAFGSYVVSSLLARLKACGLNIEEVSRARLCYPKASFYDYDFETKAQQQVTVGKVTSFATHLSPSILSTIRIGLQKMPEKTRIPTFTQNIGKRFLLSVGGVVLASLLSLPIVQQNIEKILGNIWTNLR